MLRIGLALVLVALWLGGAWALQPMRCLSIGSDQPGLAITTNTTLTVPARAVCAHFSLETANVRVTSDGTSATTTNGDLIVAGATWTDCGPLAQLKFTAVSGSPTLNVRYFQCQ